VTGRALKAIPGGASRGLWAELWTRDTWWQLDLPNGDLSSTHRGERVISFQRIAQPWLKEAAKRWVRARVLAGTSISSLSSYMSDLSAFSEWLDAQRPDVSRPQALTRTVLEDYMLFIRTEPLKSSTRLRRIGTLRSLVEEQRKDGLRGLPETALIHAAELPRVEYQLAKTLDEPVFQELIAPDNLPQLRQEWHRTAVLLLAFTGMRISSVVTLGRDCMTHGADGQPYLRYWNVKLKREAILPIPPQLEEQIIRQGRWLDEERRETKYLLPGKRPPRGGADKHVAPSSLRRMLDTYIERAGIRGPDGELAHVFPHLFRHHMGTSMVNDGISITVVAKVLDHQSLDMTARYAQIEDETVKRETMRWHERVNIRGERIALPFDGPLGEAAWMKERIARAKQALPNGYCGLPLVQTCPHPNACLSCDNFLTDLSFRAVHEQQRAQTRRLLHDARQRQQVRLVELLEGDEQSLRRILERLEEIERELPAEDTAAGELVDLLDLADAEGAAG
jgi:site-specific recombinase XerD